MQVLILEEVILAIVTCQPMLQLYLEDGFWQPFSVFLMNDKHDETNKQQQQKRQLGLFWMVCNRLTLEVFINSSFLLIN